MECVDMTTSDGLSREWSVESERGGTFESGVESC